MLSFAEKKDHISELSKQVEKVLLFLLTENEILKERLDNEQNERICGNENLASQLESRFNELKTDLCGEIRAREVEGEKLKDDLKKLDKKSQSENSTLLNELVRERAEREDHDQQLDDFFR